MITNWREGFFPISVVFEPFSIVKNLTPWVNLLKQDPIGTVQAKNQIATSKKLKATFLFIIIIIFFCDVGIPEVFDLTRLIPRMAPAKPTQMHNRQIWGGF